MNNRDRTWLGIALVALGAALFALFLAWAGPALSRTLVESKIIEAVLRLGVQADGTRVAILQYELATASDERTRAGRLDVLAQASAADKTKLRTCFDIAVDMAKTAEGLP